MNTEVIELPVCPHCAKPLPLCVCEDITPLDNKIELLILQHPQEQDKSLGTARLATRVFAKAQLKIGLSWPSLQKALGRDVDPARWAILYLGSARVDDDTHEGVIALNRKGEPEDNQRQILRAIEGVIVLDGTWSQAKALWWRNPWMLKCARVMLAPKAASLYGKLRKEPRGDALSTLEAAGMTLARLEKRPEIETAATEAFSLMLQRYRTAQTETPEILPKPPRKRDWRRPQNRQGKTKTAGKTASKAARKT